MDGRNVSRRIAIVMSALPALAGAPVIPDGDDQAPAASTPLWVRIQIDDVDAEHAGQLQGERAELRRTQITVDVFARGEALSAPGGPRAYDVVDGVAYAVRAALSGSIDLPDYVADPTGATPGRRLNFATPATTRRLDPIDGVQRRQVTAVASLLAQV